MKYYEEQNDLVALSNSVLKYYGCETHHESLKVMDEILNKTSKKHICLVLLDGLGERIQDKHSSDCPFLISNRRHVITSVFPPTTTAATTALLTGKYPCETNWLGWNQKFEEWDEIATMFTSRFVNENETETPISTFALCDHEEIFDELRRKNPSMSFEQFKQFELEDPSAGGFLNKLDEECDKYDFLYAYSTEPDHLLHNYGAGSKEVGEMIRILDKGLEVISRRHNDVMFIVVADHGHIICEEKSIYEHEDFFSCLKYPQFSLEARASVFYVKDDKKDEFKKLAEKYYGEYFDIYTKEEILEKKIFGYGDYHERFLYTIGDFLLVAKTNVCFRQEYQGDLLSHHAGGTDLEKYIAVAVIND